MRFLRLRFATLAVRDLVMYTARTGRWWLPLLYVAVAVAVVLAAATSTAVPTTVYTLF